MRYLILFCSLFYLTSCQSQQDQIKGGWRVERLSKYPLSISSYGDLLFEKSSIIVFDGEQLAIFGNHSLKENFYFAVEDGKLIVNYSDYGIPLEIEELTERKLILTGSGSGNTENKRSRYFKIELKR